MDQLHELKITTYDGAEHITITPYFAGTADRIAWEHQFGLASIKLKLLDELFDNAGELLPSDQFPAEASEYREEWAVFLAWRCAEREIPEFHGSDLAGFTDRCAQIEIRQLKAEEATAAAPLPEAAATTG